MGRDIPVNPFHLEVGEKLNARIGYHYDNYFETPPQDSAIGRVLDQLMNKLPEEEKECVELRVFGQYSFGEIARMMDWWHPGDGKPYLNRKRAWRAYNRGLRKLKKMIGDREWLASLVLRPEVLD